MKVILACDLGGTRSKIGVVRDGQVLAHAVVPARSQQNLALQLPVIRKTWLDLLEKAGLEPGDCGGVGVAFPSLIDVASGRILDHYGKYPDCMELDLREWARAELGLPLAIDNDTRMACIGEWRYGAGRGSNNLVMVTLGTGLGSGVICEGRVLRGGHGQAGVLGGHLTVRCGGRACACGNLGCAEAEASSAVLAVAAAARADFASSGLAREPLLDYGAVFRQAAKGDACAAALRDDALRVWSSLVVNLIHAYDPELVVVGGGIMMSTPAILPALREYVGRHAHTPWGRVRVEASTLGDHAALVAAEWLLGEYAHTLLPVALKSTETSPVVPEF